MNKGKKYDYKEAYNKDLTAKARLHYLENARHDQDSPAKMESAKMKKKDLLKYNPVVDKSSGSFMSKHSQSGFASPLKKKGCKKKY
jgi:hypothetical protein